VEDFGTDGTVAHRRPRLMFLVTEDWYFWSHRLPMAQAAAAAGYEVHVATRVDRHGGLIEAAGFAVHPLAWRRSRNDPASVVRQVREVAALFRRTRPDIVHNVSLKPVLVGGLAARLTGVPAMVHGINGLGAAFTATGWRARARRFVITRLLRGVFGGGVGRGPRTVAVVQNDHDRQVLQDRRIVSADRIRVIRGSGVDPDQFQVLPEPVGPVTVAYVGRMLRNKGVDVVVEAVQEVRRRGVDLRLLLAGKPDPDNPTSFDEETVRRWAGLPGVEWLGHVADVRRVWARAHIAVLMSVGGEGVPKSLLEAAACGRPVVASRVPGCADIARDGESGTTVPVGDVRALADALVRLAGDAALRVRYGHAGRRLVAAGFSAEEVGRQVVASYRGLLPTR